MEALEATPTAPRNYALISGAFAAAFGATALVGRSREPVHGGELLPLGLATFTFTRVLTQQKVATWLRRPFVAEPADGPRHPRRSGMRYAVGELLSCTRCTGSWVALGLVALRLRAPSAGGLAIAVGTVGAVNDTALAGFSWLTSATNAAGAG